MTQTARLAASLIRFAGAGSPRHGEALFVQPASGLPAQGAGGLGWRGQWEVRNPRRGEQRGVRGAEG